MTIKQNSSSNKKKKEQVQIQVHYQLWWLCKFVNSWSDAVVNSASPHKSQIKEQNGKSLKEKKKTQKLREKGKTNFLKEGKTTETCSGDLTRGFCAIIICNATIVVVIASHHSFVRSFTVETFRLTINGMEKFQLQRKRH